MTVPVQDTFTASIANGVTTVFPYGFKITDAADLEVSIDGVVTTIGFTVSGVGDASGSVTFAVAPANETKVLLSLNPILKRTTDIQQFGDWVATVVNKEFDRIWLALQKQKQNDTRALKLPIDTADDQLIVEDATGRAGKVVAFDAFGRLLLMQAQTGTSLIDLMGSAGTSLIRGTWIGGIVAAISELGTSIGASLVGFIQDGVGAVLRSIQDELRDTVKVTQFGASPAKTAAQNLAAFKAAVVATATGGRLIVPIASGPYSIDTSGGLSTAILIDRRMEIVFEGDVKANFSAIQANPPYIFKVTAHDVVFSGAGRIIGDGTVNTLNAGSITDSPGLVYVSGDNFRMSGVTVDTPPKFGVALVSCYNAILGENTFTGGATTLTAGNTALFGVRLFGGGNHIIVGNRFVPDLAGGMCITGIFGESSNGNLIEGNTAIKPYEKLCYLYGDNNIVTGNYVKGNSGTIPGTAQSGTITSVYRVVGSYNKITNNVSDYCLGGATAMDGIYNDISNNTFRQCGQSAVAVFASGAGYAGGFNGTTIRNNIGTAVVMPGVTLQDGILFNTNYADSYAIDISSNHMLEFSPTNATADIRVIAQSPFGVRYSTIGNNILTSGANGLLTDRVTNSAIRDNYVRGTSVQGLTESGGANNKWSNNQCDSAQIGIAGLAATSEGNGNRYTAASLVGTTTLSAAVTSTVTHGGVAPNARVFLQTSNDAAGILIVSRGWPTPAISGNNFTIKMANGVAAAGNESFHYNVVQ